MRTGPFPIVFVPQVVHHDVHPDNVLVDPNDPTRVVGVIDFGDMLFAPVLADLAAACDSFDDENLVTK